MSTKVRATRTTPCKICGGYKEQQQHIGERCAGYEKDGYAFCTREQYAGDLRLLRTDPPSYKHNLSGACGCGKSHDAGLANGRVTRSVSARRRTLEDIDDVSPLDWWERYTGVSRDEWELLGCDEDDTHVFFDFSGADARKRRRKGTKEISWDGTVSPPIWPIPEESLPTDVAIAEGESDCGVLRHLGFHAFTPTKGASGTQEGGLDVDLFSALKERGVERVTFFPDTDSSGRAFRAAGIVNAQGAGLSCCEVDLSPYRDVTRAENDVRSLFLRYSRQEFLKIVKTQWREVEPARPRIDSFDDLLQWADEDVDYLIGELVIRGTKTLIGAPTKSLKTWFTLHLVACCATCSPLLEIPEYAIERPIRTLLVEEEGQRQMFGRRVKKVFNGISRDVQAEPVFRFRRGFNLLDHAQVTDLIQALRDEAIDLLILDPLQRITPGLDENSNSDLRRVWDAVNRIILECPHVAVIVVAHNRKGDDLSWDSVRGGALQGGEQDLGIFIRKEGGATRTEATYRGTLALALDGRELPQEFTKEGGAMEVEYVFDSQADTFVMRATGEVTVTVRPTQRKVGEDNETAVFEAVRDTSQGASKDDLRAVLHIAPRTIEKHLASLTRNGRLVREELPQESGGVKAIWKAAHGA